MEARLAFYFRPLTRPEQMVASGRVGGMVVDFLVNHLNRDQRLRRDR